MEMFDYPHQTTLYPQPTEQASQAIFIETPAEREQAIRRAVEMARDLHIVPDATGWRLVEVPRYRSDDIIKELMK